MLSSIADHADHLLVCLREREGVTTNQSQLVINQVIKNVVEIASLV